MAFWDLFNSGNKGDGGVRQEPKAEGREESAVDLSAAFDDPFADAVAPPQQPPQQETAPQQVAPQIPRQPVLNKSSLEAQIQTIGVEINSLEENLADPEKYRKADGTIDNAKYNADQLKYQRLNREYTNLATQRPIVHNESSSHRSAVRTHAESYLKQQIGSIRASKEVKDQILKEFTDIYKAQAQQGAFDSNEMQSAQNRDRAFQTMYSLAVGSTYTKMQQAPKSEASGDFQGAANNSLPDTNTSPFTQGSVASQLYDEFVNNRQAKGQTVGQAKRMEQERMAMEAQYNADPQGFRDRLSRDPQLMQRYQELRKTVIPASAKDMTVSELNARMQQEIAGRANG